MGTHVKPASIPPINTKHNTTASLSQYAGVPGFVSGSSASMRHVGEEAEAEEPSKSDRKKGLLEDELEAEDEDAGSAAA